MMEIKTERLVLKKPEHKDKQSIIFRIGNWEVTKRLSGVHYPYTENDAGEWIQTLSWIELTFNIFAHDSLVDGFGLTHHEVDWLLAGLTT